MKKIILTCLAAAMTLAGSAQETATIDGINYLLDGGKASVMQQKGLTGDIVIPETVRYDGDDYTVTTVQSNAFSGNDITGVVLPNTVTVMGSSCFSSCFKLVSADLPDNITSLGDESFYHCYALKSVGLPEAIVSLGDMCFKGCDNIETVELPAGVASLGSECFSGCLKLTAINLPKGITDLGDNCFSECTSLTSVTLPASLTTIGRGCFSSCWKLVSVNFEGSLTELKSSCFYYCTSLESIDVPQGVRELGDNCFYGCSSLKSVSLPDGVTDLGSSCFYNCTALQAITLPNSINYIGGECFMKCSALESIVVPSGIIKLNEECFSNCSKLASVTLPESIEMLSYSCFSNCTSLSGIALPAGLKSIGSGCFYKCGGLTSILLPRSVEELGRNCFSDCTYLADITCQWDDPDEVNTDNKMFDNIYTECRLHVPVGTTTLYKAKEPWSGFKFIIEEDGQVVDPVRCATPTIAYADNSLTFGCATEGAEYHYTISASDAVEGAYSADGKVALGAAYDITVYASAHGYLNSEEAKAVLCFIDATLNTAGINLGERRGVVVSSHDGSITVSGLADGEQVALYSVSGMMLSAGKASAGSITLSAGRTDGVVLVKIADRSIKISVNRQ